MNNQIEELNRLVALNDTRIDNILEILNEITEILTNLQKQDEKTKEAVTIIINVLKHKGILSQ